MPLYPGPRPQLVPSLESQAVDTLQAQLIEQYHQRVDLSELLSDEDFEGLVL